MYSWISRHLIVDNNLWHYTFFVLHDILIPFFLGGTLWLIASQQRQCGSRLHTRFGSFLLQIVCPILSVSGFVLSRFSPFGYFFASYGISFCTLAFHTYVSGASPRRVMDGFRRLINSLHYISIGVLGISLGLSMMMGSWKLKELCWATFPLIYFHYRLVTAYRSSVATHRLASYVLTYSGWMGTVFSIINDRYWLFPNILIPLSIRMFIQQMPLVILVLSIPENRLDRSMNHLASESQVWQGNQKCSTTNVK